MNHIKPASFYCSRGGVGGQAQALMPTVRAVRRGSGQLAEPWGSEKGRGGAGPRELPLAAQGACEETHSPQEAHPGPTHSSGPHGLPTPRWSGSRKGLGPADPSWVPSLCSDITHHGAPSPGPGLRPPHPALHQDPGLGTHVPREAGAPGTHRASSHLARSSCRRSGAGTRKGTCSSR